MNRSLKLLIIFSCVILILGAFYYGYYTTMNRIGNQKPVPKQTIRKPNAIIDNNSYSTDEYVDNVPGEDRVTPKTILQKKIHSINTDAEMVEYEELVPDKLVNLTKDEVVKYFQDTGTVQEFSKDKIVVVRKLPYLPDCYVLKIEGEFIVVYFTNSDGIPAKYDNFEPIQCKNRDDKLKKGIEVRTEDEIWETIGDYE